jgi:hypothetical protein
MLSNAALTVPSGGTLAVTGTLTLGSGSTFDVNGTVTAVNGCIDNGANISGTGSQPCGSVPAGVTRTWVGGVSNNWHDGANWNPAGVPTSIDTVLVSGASVNPVLAMEDSVASITIGGLNGVDLGGTDLWVLEDVDAGGGSGFYNGYVILGTPGSVLQGQFDNLDISQTNRVQTGALYLQGDLTLNDAMLDTDGQFVSMTGNLWVQGTNGILVMDDPSTVVTVFGNALFSGGDHNGFLTDGLLQVAGDFHATDASNGSFAASGNHVLAISGSTPQDVIFEIPGPTNQHANDLTMSSYGTATFQTSATVTRTLYLNANTIFPASVTVGTANLTLGSGSVTQLDGTLTVGGQCTDLGGIVVGTTVVPPACVSITPVDRVWAGGDPVSPTDWQDGNNWLPAGVPTATDAVVVPPSSYFPALSASTTIGSLTVTLGAIVDQNGFTLTVAGDVSALGTVTNGFTVVTGTADIEGSFEFLDLQAPSTLVGSTQTQFDLVVRDELVIGSQTLVVSGDLIVPTAGYLDMQAPTGVAAVFGNASFLGESSVGHFNDGGLYLYGDLDVLSVTSPTSFQTTGTEVYFVGSTDQTVYLDNPALTGQFFTDLFVAQGGQGTALIFDSDIHATGLFSVFNGILRQGVSGTAALTVAGQVDFSLVTLDGVPLEIVSSVSPDLHNLTDVTFTNFQPSDVQLYVELPGAGVNGQLLLNNPVFELPAPTTGYYIQGVNTTQSGVQLVIELINPTPASQTRYLEGSLTSIVWP